SNARRSTASRASTSDGPRAIRARITSSGSGARRKSRCSGTGSPSTRDDDARLKPFRLRSQRELRRTRRSLWRRRARSSGHRPRGQADQFASLAGVRAFPSLHELLDDTRPDVVHVCTPPSAHFDAAHEAIAGGANVYVEKPFALTKHDAARLLDLARVHGRIVCAGHQLLCDPAFGTLLKRAGDLGELVQADSHFAFRPPGAAMARAGARALARQLVDVLPHPLYALVAVLERF